MICKKCKIEKNPSLFKRKELRSSNGRRFSYYKTCKKCKTGIDDPETIIIEGEEWKNINGYIGLYQVSNKGRIKSLGNGKYKTDKIVKICYDRVGYCYVCLWKKGISKKFKAHRLVAIHFIPNPRKRPHVNHKNGIKSDNFIENLEWCTSKQNIRHAINTGLRKIYGSDNPSAKLTIENIKYIRENFKKNPGELSKMFGVSSVSIYNIVKMKTWKNISKS